MKSFAHAGRITVRPSSVAEEIAWAGTAALSLVKISFCRMSS